MNSDDRRVAVSFDSFQRRSRLIVGNCLRARKTNNSFAGEYLYLKSLVSKLSIEGGYVVDVAASDGVTQSSTLGFFADPDWRGLAVEMDPEKFSSLAFLYAEFKNVALARCRVTPDTIGALLQGHDVPSDFALLNLDIDSYDLFVMEEILRRGFMPKIISMEINEKIPPPLFFAVKFDEGHYWQGDHFFGCSMTAAAKTVKPHGYKLDSLQFNNAVFVRQDIGQGVITDQAVDLAYDIGYRNHPDRAKLFPWNADVDCALSQTVEQNVAFFARKFEKYEGKFILHA